MSSRALSLAIATVLAGVGCSSHDSDQTSAPPAKPAVVADARTLAPTADAPPAAPNPVDAHVPDGQPPRYSWLRHQPALVEVSGADVPMGEGMEVTLLPFAHDPLPVETWRYDECIAARSCAARAYAQPPGDRDAPAVGMTWKHAAVYCGLRGLDIQSGTQDAVIAESEHPRRIELLAVDPDEFVTYGFRCVRTGD